MTRPTLPDPDCVNPSLDEDGQLQCPGCGGSHLHHTSVEVFSRKEDEEQGSHIVVSNTDPQFSGDHDVGLRVNGLMQGNPSSRRSGIAIRFACETCDHASEFLVAQHKGTTFVAQRVV